MFGGEWTEEKLRILKGYLDAYTQALKNKPFDLLYIDSFAGTGYREMEPEEPEGVSLFEELLAEETEELLDGSARISLQIQRPFDRYIFVEMSPEKARRLEALKEDFPELADRIVVEVEDCNSYLQAKCRQETWRGRRAVLFLDPFGMQVEWATMESIAATGTIDTWVLFPISAVNRMLPRSGEIPAGWEQRLDKLFGTHEWHSTFYRLKPIKPLFGQKKRPVKKVCRMKDICQYYLDRLRTVFPAVAEHPRWLCNSRGTPLFVFCFAMANPSQSAQNLALRIAQHLLREE